MTVSTGDEVVSALLTLHTEALILNPRQLDQAWLTLTGSSLAVTCSVCGQITRHVQEGRHIGC